MKQFVILLNYSSGTSRGPAVEQKLSAIAPDWMRFGIGQYIVSTERQDASFVYDELKPLLQPADYLLVAEVNLANRKGWAMPVAVNWINQHSP